MATVDELKPEELRRTCDPEQWEFESTADLDALDEVLGQERAMEAIDFGTGVEGEGFNLFAVGPRGLGRQTLLRQVLEERTAGSGPPPDWCYVNNFDQPQSPRLLRLEPGRGGQLRREMEQLVDELTTALAAAFESEEYQTRRQVIEQEMSEEQESSISELGKEAKEHGLTLLRTPMGIVVAPIEDDEVLAPDEFEKLPEEERERLEKEIERLQGELQRLFRQVPRLQRARRERLRELNRQVSRATVGPMIDELRERHEDSEEVLRFLDAVEADVVDHARTFVAQESQRSQQEFEGMMANGTLEPALPRRYGVNLLVDHADADSRPVVYEDHPTYQNLVGRIEHMPRMGALITDFSMIRPGALHRANGGYLLLDVDKLLVQPFAWEGLKRALKSRQVRIESLGQALSLISTYSLEPEPMPLDLKVVLLGDRRLYYLLSLYDPEFGQLFKVAADFAERIERDDGNQLRYARLLARLVREHDLKPFDRSALARTVDESARMMGDGERLSLYMSRIVDLLREADHWAGDADREVVTDDDVERAVGARERRSDRLRERIQEEIRRGTILIDTAGSEVGQINALSVLQVGDFAFGRPSRITARARLGGGELVNIEREVELSGPLHSKGVLILSGFLGQRYAAETPLSLSASLVFEQSYGGVDGDSASSAELYALLSAIAGIPLSQSLAVTGSVNQHGAVQAIGGVNEKIEGFFDVCAARGLDGSHGVLIPAANVQHLMLAPRVVEAVAAGEFHIWPVATVDQGIELLTDVPAGEPDEEGEYPEGTVNRRVKDRLAEVAERRREFSGGGWKKGPE